MTKGAKPDTWMPLFIGDYLKDTARLSTEQHGAYLLLIMDYWTNGPPADDDEELAAICRLDVKVWRRYRPKIDRFFQVVDKTWRHKRIDEELSAAQGNADRRAERAQAAAQARWGKGRAKQSSEDAPSNADGNASSNAQGHAQSMLEECPSPSPSPKSRMGPIGPVRSAAPTDEFREQVDKLWSAANRTSRGRSSRKDVERAAKAALGRGHDFERILAGVEGYFRSREATRDEGEYSKGLHRVIENDRWEEFAPAGGGLLGHHNQDGDPLRNPTEFRQRLWMQDLKAGQEWREHERGPRPGDPGCRVAAEIQREFGVEPAPPQPVRGAA